jgi:taurine dioxygenase
MPSQPTALNNGFGALINDVKPDDLRDEAFQRQAYEHWSRCGGLLAVRGAALAELTPQALLDWAQVFGAVERENQSGREASTIEGYPILRIGNIKDAAGKLRSSFAKVPVLSSDEDVRYNPETRRPVWHTDSTFRKNPPIGSAFHCKHAPPQGGETLFANTRGAYEALDEATQQRLDGLEAVCSLAHHDMKIHLYTPTYPTLNAEQRAANPARRVPLVLTHPVSGKPALYGLNSSTCAIVRKGEAVSDERMDVFDLQGIEDESVLILRELLPFVTGPDFTVCWRWQPGDVVVWDNRCTIHAATGFDNESDTREMWRLTLLDRAHHQSAHGTV